ncbi:MAG: XRE family transcriptional regulator [Spirochaetes bacterium]|nr:XRE family transcriptional regulator [Spirochaetota bacterium]
MDFWQRVEDRRRAENTTYRWIAENVVKKSETTVSGWRSHGVLPRADDAVAIAKALRTTVEYLVTGETGNTRTERTAAICEAIALLGDDELLLAEQMINLFAGTGRLQRPAEQHSQASGE